MWCYLSNCISINKLVFTRPVICAHFHGQRTGTKSNHYHHFYLGFIKKRRCSSLTCYTLATREFQRRGCVTINQQHPLSMICFMLILTTLTGRSKVTRAQKKCPLQVLLLSIMLNVQPGQAPHRPLLTKNKHPGWGLVSQPRLWGGTIELSTNSWNNIHVIPTEKEEDKRLSMPVPFIVAQLSFGRLSNTYHTDRLNLWDKSGKYKWNFLLLSIENKNHS